MKKLKIHFVGIKGTNMTPLALIAKDAGFEVTGSDVDQEFITDLALKNAKIKPLIGFFPENIHKPDLVITTGAHGGFDNPEVKRAREQKIKVITAGEATGLFMNGEIFGKKFTGISVAGTHGKTTTSAMVATILKENKLDPSYIIGTGHIPSLGSPGYLGKGKYFVAEADEYVNEPVHDKTPRFLWQHPQLMVITNIEHDHPDVYPSIIEVCDAFRKFILQLPPRGVLIACGDDIEIRKIIKDLSINTITYGFNKDNNYILENVHIAGEHMFFSVISRDMKIGEFMLRVIGEHNGLNALSAIITCLELGLSIEKIKKGLLAFSGSKRRLEYVGELLTGAKLYDDYAHHPTEIKKTLGGLRAQYPKKKIVIIFQPHTYSRTKKLFDEFINSFNVPDVVILTEIYPSLREIADPSISSELLYEKIKSQKREVVYLPKLADVVKYINEKRFGTDTVIITMGAGDIYKISTDLKMVKQ